MSCHVMPSPDICTLFLPECKCPAPSIHAQNPRPEPTSQTLERGTLTYVIFERVLYPVIFLPRLLMLSNS